MLLYRYFGSHTYETLRDAKLKASRLTNFNDPFEYLFVTKGKITASMARKYVLSRLDHPDFLRQAALRIPGLLTSKNPKQLLEPHIPRITANLVNNSESIVRLPLREREQLAESIRVVSFSDAKSKSLDEILLWSHYAKMHEGIRIGFEFPEDIKYPFKVYKVNYSEKRYEIDFANGILTFDVLQALIESAKVKSLAWQYENEYRILTHPDCCEKVELGSLVECFLAFDRNWVKAVDFGVRCPQSEIQRISDLLKSDYPKNILCQKAVFHESEYALNCEPV